MRKRIIILPLTILSVALASPTPAPAWERAVIEAMRAVIEGAATAAKKAANSPLLRVKLGWHHMVRAYTFVSDDPRSDIRKAGELTRQVLANEQLSPQVARLSIWLMSYVLVQERDFDGAFPAANKVVASAPFDMFALIRCPCRNCENDEAQSF
jgi:hypothetical protein